jgi:hypothetical protein
LKNFESVCLHTVDKFYKKDTKKDRFSKKMKLRKMSNARRHNYPVVFMGLAPTIVLTNLHKKERNLFDGAIIVLMGGCKLDTRTKV